MGGWNWMSELNRIHRDLLFPVMKKVVSAIVIPHR